MKKGILGSLPLSQASPMAICSCTLTRHWHALPSLRAALPDPRFSASRPQMPPGPRSGSRPSGREPRHSASIRIEALRRIVLAASWSSFKISATRMRTACDAAGKWSAQGKLAWPWGAEYDQPQPIRVCYPNVALRNRALYFCGVSDIVEPYQSWRQDKKQLTGREWDYDASSTE